MTNVRVYDYYNQKTIEIPVIEVAEVPPGWRQYMDPMTAEINAAVGDDPDYVVEQIKEKYNTLRWYANKTNDEIEAIIDKYSDLCEKTCVICGKPATHVSTRGWVESLCNECDKERSEHWWVPM